MPELGRKKNLFVLVMLQGKRTYNILTLII